MWGFNFGHWTSRFGYKLFAENVETWLQVITERKYIIVFADKAENCQRTCIFEKN